MKLTPAYLAEIIKLVDAGTINTTTGKSLLAQGGRKRARRPAQIVEAEGLAQGQRRFGHPRGVPRRCWPKAPRKWRATAAAR